MKKIIESRAENSAETVKNQPSKKQPTGKSQTRIVRVLFPAEVITRIDRAAAANHGQTRSQFIEETIREQLPHLEALIKEATWLKKPQLVASGPVAATAQAASQPTLEEALSGLQDAVSDLSEKGSAAVALLDLMAGSLGTLHEQMKECYEDLRKPGAEVLDCGLTNLAWDCGLALIDSLAQVEAALAGFGKGGGR